MSVDTSWLGRQLHLPASEPTNVDKVLAKEEVKRLQALMKKNILTRDELLEITYMLGSVEVKLVSFNEWDRYLLGKFLVWIGEFSIIAEKQYDMLSNYEKQLTELEAGTNIKLEKTTEDAIKAALKQPGNERLLRRQDFVQDQLQMGRKNMMNLQHNFKFLVTLYLYLSRSTLSLNAIAFENFTKSRIENLYATSEREVAEKRGWITRLRGG